MSRMPDKKDLQVQGILLTATLVILLALAGCSDPTPAPEAATPTPRAGPDKGPGTDGIRRPQEASTERATAAATAMPANSPTPEAKPPGRQSRLQK